MLSLIHSSDVIMYALFNTKTGEVDILRIPRDTFVGSEFPTGKVNAIYGHPYEGISWDTQNIHFTRCV